MKNILRRIAFAALLAIPTVAFAGDFSKKESCCSSPCCPGCPMCPR